LPLLIFAQKNIPPEGGIHQPNQPKTYLYHSYLSEVLYHLLLKNCANTEKCLKSQFKGILHMRVVPIWETQFILVKLLWEMGGRLPLDGGLEPQKVRIF